MPIENTLIEITTKLKSARISEKESGYLTQINYDISYYTSDDTGLEPEIMRRLAADMIRKKYWKKSEQDDQGHFDFNSATLNDEELTPLAKRYLIMGLLRQECYKDKKDFFRKADLHSVDLSKIEFPDNTDFTEADLQGANLSNSRLRGAIFTGAKLTRTKLIEADCTEATFENATLSEANLSKAILTRANMKNANCTRADFEEVILKEANLTNSNFSYAKLVRTICLMANFDDTILKNAECYQADLRSPTISKSKLEKDVGKRALDGAKFLSEKHRNLTLKDIFLKLSSGDLSNALHTTLDIQSRVYREPINKLASEVVLISEFILKIANEEKKLYSEEIALNLINITFAFPAIMQKVIAPPKITKSSSFGRLFSPALELPEIDHVARLQNMKEKLENGEKEVERKTYAITAGAAAM